MRLGPKDLINDLQSFGFFFEDMAVRDLRVYAEALDGAHFIITETATALNVTRSFTGVMEVMHLLKLS